VLYPSSYLVLDLHQPPTPRRRYDNGVVISLSPRLPWLRSLGSHLRLARFAPVRRKERIASVAAADEPPLPEASTRLGNVQLESCRPTRFAGLELASGTTRAQ